MSSREVVKCWNSAEEIRTSCFLEVHLLVEAFRLLHEENSWFGLVPKKEMVQWERGRSKRCGQLPGPSGTALPSGQMRPRHSPRPFAHVIGTGCKKIRNIIVERIGYIQNSTSNRLHGRLVVHSRGGASGLGSQTDLVVVAIEEDVELLHQYITNDDTCISARS